MIEQSNYDNKQQKKSKSIKNINSLQKQFQIKQVIGRGTFGTVYSAYWITRGINVAIKSIIKNPKFKNRQIQILSLLKNPSIVEMLMHYQKYDEAEKKLYINLIMEYVPTTLLSLIRSANAKHSKFQIGKIVMYSKKLLEGLAYLQQKNICHRDIKPSNLLIDETDNHVKICDFGSAKQLKKGQKSITYICSRYYRAPQLILGCTQYSTKIDIWSAGCVIAQMITLHPLFDGYNNLDQIAKIVKILGKPSKQQLIAMKIDNLNQEIDQVVAIGLANKIKKGNNNNQKLIVYDPNKRLSAKQALNHPVFKI